MNKKDFGYNTDCCCLTDREINQILMKENQALKYRWEKLKEFVGERMTYFNKYEDDFAVVYELVKDKMLELEKETK